MWKMWTKPFLAPCHATPCHNCVDRIYVSLVSFMQVCLYLIETYFLSGDLIGVMDCCARIVLAKMMLMDNLFGNLLSFQFWKVAIVCKRYLSLK